MIAPDRASLLQTPGNLAAVCEVHGRLDVRIILGKVYGVNRSNGPVGTYVGGKKAKYAIIVIAKEAHGGVSMVKQDRGQGVIAAKWDKLGHAS